MAQRRHAPLLAVASLVVAMISLGCDVSIGEQRRPLTSVVTPTPASQTPVAPAAPIDQQAPDARGDSSTVVADGSHDYQTMCRHYCEALAETNFYYCVNTGQQLDGCTAMVTSFPDLCIQDRCVPQLVQQPLCFTQCTAVAKLYDVVCAAGSTYGDDPAVCPSAPADHDAACRAGCGPSATP